MVCCSKIKPAVGWKIPIKNESRQTKDIAGFNKPNINIQNANLNSKEKLSYSCQFYRKSY